MQDQFRIGEHRLSGRIDQAVRMIGMQMRQQYRAQ
jgi:hypothetical protein